ncbi:hypothetical protein RB653_004491 [Dictyostelium firmibasis]|uniref:Uncharacterized protein n=1 Tax=Dictyostelium firmibasis TaxID=79012 RepID=A0AAN7U144_9MYCE
MLSSSSILKTSSVAINYQQYIYPIIINRLTYNYNIRNKNYKNYSSSNNFQSDSIKFQNEFQNNLKIYNKNNNNNININNNNNNNNNISKFFNNQNIDKKVMKHFYSSTKLNYARQQQQQLFKNNNEVINEPIGSSLLPIINKLQENASLIGSEITLPQIIVVGSQSSGKSSVLENLVGRDFLPRGSGLVTRRPLVLQLYQTTRNSNIDQLQEQENEEDDNNNNTINDDIDEEWGEFGHSGTKKFNFKEIKEEIERETERIAGPNKDISSEPIVLKIYSPKVIPLTLVDLPGLTRVAIEDQPPNIEEKIKSMIINHISNPNSIILAITPANQDIVTSDALKLAQEVDPLGKRTIGVLTKLDLMDKGTDAIDILLGNSIPLNLGFVGVVNRSQQDILNKKPIEKMLVDESKWFDQHPVYNRITNQLGTQYLAQKCSKILTRHIRDTFPSVKNQIRHLIKKYESDLEKYGEPIPLRVSEKSRLLFDILNEFSRKYRADLDGTNEELVLNEFNGGARIRYIFSKAFQSNNNDHHGLVGGSIEEQPFDWLSDQQLKIALRNSGSTMFIPQKIFDSLIRKQLERVREPLIQTSEYVLDELLRILTQADYSNVLSRFPVLKERIVEVSNNSLRKLLKECNQSISQMVDAEMSFINTNHPSYVHQLNNLLASSSSASFVPQGTFPTTSKHLSSSSSSSSSSLSQNSNPYNDALNPYNIDRSYPIDSQIKQQQQQIQQQKQYQQQNQKQQQPGFLSRIFGSSPQQQPQQPQQPPQQLQQQQQPQQQYEIQYQQNSKKQQNLIVEDKKFNLEQYGLNDITEDEKKQIYLLRKLLLAYNDIAQFNLQQNTMKLISLLLIDKSKDILQKELIDSLYDQSSVDQLLRENELVVAKRNECIYKLELLKKAKKSLSQSENSDLLHLY